MTDLQRIFKPQNIAIIGVSTEGFGFGRGILLSLLKYGFAGEIFPVNPKGGKIKGLNIYRKIEDIPSEIDFAIIAVPAAYVPEALEACRLKGAAGAEILTSGFDEANTSEGRELNNKIKEISQNGIRVIGPNCFGIYCPAAGLTLLPGPDLSKESGNVALISQSGGMSIDFAYLGMWKGFRFSKVISYGNGMDLRETELLEFLGKDPDTAIIGMYVEGLENGEKFANVLKDVTRQKPVIIMKGGLSDAGQRAVQSHTASLGGSRKIWESVFRQCNVTQVSNLNEMSDTALAFSMLPKKTFKGISIIGGGGALGVIATDIAEFFNMVIPEYEKDIQKRIMKHVPDVGASGKNPVDFGNPFITPEMVRESLRIAGEDPGIDIQVVTLMIFHYKTLRFLVGADSIEQVTPYRELVDAVEVAVKKTSKPVIIVLPNYRKENDTSEIVELIRKTRSQFLEKRIPVFDEMEDALRAVRNVSVYYERIQSQY